MGDLCLIPEPSLSLAADEHGVAPLERGAWFSASEAGIIREYRFAPGLLAEFAWIWADTLLDGVDLTIFLLEQRECFDGESLMPLVRGETSECRGWAFSSYSGGTSNTMSWMLRKGDYKLVVYDGYPSRLFNLRKDPEELKDLIDQEPEIAVELLAIIDAEVDRAATVKIWEDYRRHNFAQFQRQAKNGLYYDCSYGLAENPSSDYHQLMNNTFTGWDEEDEDRGNAWLTNS